MKRFTLSNAIFQGVFLFVNESDLHVMLPTGVSTAPSVLTASSLQRQELSTEIHAHRLRKDMYFCLKWTVTDISLAASKDKDGDKLKGNVKEHENLVLGPSPHFLNWKTVYIMDLNIVKC